MATANGRGTPRSAHSFNPGSDSRRPHRHSNPGPHARPQDALQDGQMTYELRELVGEGEIRQALRLRAQVWRAANVDLTIDASGCHQDSDDAAATHLGVLIGDRLVAASRMSLLSGIESLSFARRLTLD